MMKANKIIVTLLLASFGLPARHVFAQENATGESNADDEESTPVSYFSDGTVGIEMDGWYYSASSRYQQNATQEICFVDSVLPPELMLQLTAQLCPSGPMSLADCKAQCELIGLPSLVSCPLNLAGCCECPFFSFHNNNMDAGDIYEFDEDNVFWGILPGWVNLGVWSFLLLALLFLIFSMQHTSAPYLEIRKNVIVASRALSIAGFMMFAMWMIIYLIAMNGIGYQTYYAFNNTAIGIFSHVVGSSIWSIAGALQLVAAIRRRWPRVHRTLGWICMCSSILSTIGLLVLVLAPHRSSIGGTVISLIFAAYWNVALGLGVYYIVVKRDIESHRRWMTRHLFVGASVMLQRIFAVLNDDIFRDPPYYVGVSFYEAACESPSSISVVSIESASPSGEESQVFLNAAQMSFACRGISGLFDAYTFTFQFAFVFVICGIFGCELWLWACGLQASQQSIALADCTSNFDIPPTQQGLKLSIRRVIADEIVITLAEKETIAEDVFMLRFRFPNEKEALLVPQMGHVNLRREGMLRPRPYSPLHALEPGHITFCVRHKHGGLLSSYLTQSMQIGDTMLLSGPSAPVGIPQGPYPSRASNFIVIAGGTGIAPFLSMFESTDAIYRVLVRDSSEERAIPLKACDDKDNISLERFFDNDTFRDRLDRLKVDIDKDHEGSKPGLILICGPNAFNVAVKSAVKSFGIPCFAVGTDDR